MIKFCEYSDRNNWDILKPIVDKLIDVDYIEDTDNLFRVIDNNNVVLTKEVVEWISENITTIGIAMYSFYFLDEREAILFKLKWL